MGFLIVLFLAIRFRTQPSNGNRSPFCRRTSSMMRMTATVHCGGSSALCRQPCAAQRYASRISYSKPLTSKGAASSRGASPSRQSVARCALLKSGMSMCPFVP